MTPMQALAFIEQVAVRALMTKEDHLKAEQCFKQLVEYIKNHEPQAELKKETPKE